MRATPELARLRRIGGFILDLDGTLALGDRTLNVLRPLPGAIAFIEHLMRTRRPFLIVTNGTAQTPAELTASLQEAGFPLSEVVVETPSSIAARYFRRRGIRRVMAVGAEAVATPLSEAGIEVVEPRGRPKVDAVMVGWCRHCTIENVEAAIHAVEQGARPFTSSMSPYFASAHGRVVGTSRIICAGITSLTGRRPTVLGKPSLEALRIASQRLGVGAADVAVVGDDPALEVRMAHRGGALAVSVATGLQAAPGEVPRDQRPHIAVKDIGELLGLLTAEDVPVC